MSWREVAERFAKAFDITVDELLGQSLAQAFAHPRQALYLCLREKFGWSSPQIGRRLGRDHGSVLSGAKAAKARLETSPDFAERYRRACQ